MTQEWRVGRGSLLFRITSCHVSYEYSIARVSPSLSMFHDAWPSNPPNLPRVDRGFLLPSRGHRADILECETCVISLWIAGSFWLLWFTQGSPAFVARHLTCRCTFFHQHLISRFFLRVFLNATTITTLYLLAITIMQPRMTPLDALLVYAAPWAESYPGESWVSMIPWGVGLVYPSLKWPAELDELWDFRSLNCLSPLMKGAGFFLVRFGPDLDIFGLKGWGKHRTYCTS